MFVDRRRFQEKIVLILITLALMQSRIAQEHVGTLDILSVQQILGDLFPAVNAHRLRSGRAQCNHGRQSLSLLFQPTKRLAPRKPLDLVGIEVAKVS